MGTCYSKKSQMPQTGLGSKNSKASEAYEQQLDQKEDNNGHPVALHKPYGGRYGPLRNSKVQFVPRDKTLEDVGSMESVNSTANKKDENLNSLKKVTASKSMPNRFGFKSTTVVKATIHKAYNEVPDTHSKVHSSRTIAAISTEKEKSEDKSNWKNSDSQLGTNHRDVASQDFSTDDTINKRNHDDCENSGDNYQSEECCESDALLQEDMYNRNLSSTPTNIENVQNGQKKVYSDGASTEFSKQLSAMDGPVINKNLVKALAPIAASEMVESMESPSIMSVDSDDLMLETEVDLGDYDYSDDLLDTSVLASQPESSYRAEHVMQRNRADSRRQRRSVNAYERTPSREEESTKAGARMFSRGISIGDTNAALVGENENNAFATALQSVAVSASPRLRNNYPKAVRPTSLPSSGKLNNTESLPSQAIPAESDLTDQSHSTMPLFKPPRSYSLGESDSVTIDGCTYRHLLQEVTILKTMLFKLKRLIQDDDIGSPMGNTWQVTSNLGNIFASKAFTHEESQAEHHVHKLTQVNQTLKQEMCQLQKQLEEKDKTISLLQQQLTKYECEPKVKNNNQGRTNTTVSRTSDPPQMVPKLSSANNSQLARRSPKIQRSMSNDSETVGMNAKEYSYQNNLSEQVQELDKTYIEDSSLFMTESPTHKLDSPSTEESSGFEDMLSIGKTHLDDSELDQIVEEKAVKPPDKPQKTAKIPTFSSIPNPGGLKSKSAILKPGVIAPAKKPDSRPLSGKFQVASVNKENITTKTNLARPASANIPTKISQGTKKEASKGEARPQSATQGKIPTQTGLSKPATKPSHSKLPTFNTKASKLRPPTVRNH